MIATYTHTKKQHAEFYMHVNIMWKYIEKLGEKNNRPIITSSGVNSLMVEISLSSINDAIDYDKLLFCRDVF